jgi:hypothetical protein
VKILSNERLNDYDEFVFTLAHPILNQVIFLGIEA